MRFLYKIKSVNKKSKKVVIFALFFVLLLNSAIVFSLLNNNISEKQSEASEILEGFEEKDGLLVIQAESIDPAIGWTEEDSVDVGNSFTGDGYFKWTGPAYMGEPGHGEIAYKIIINTPGLYTLNIRNYHNNPDPSEDNDVWTKMDDGPWIKTFSGTKDEWTWATNHELSEDNKPAATYDLTAGQHTFYLSGRSVDFYIDKYHFFLPGTTGFNDWDHEESEYVNGASATSTPTTDPSENITPSATEEVTPGASITTKPQPTIPDNAVECGDRDANGDGEVNVGDFDEFKDIYEKPCLDEPSIEGCGGNDAIIDGVFDGYINIEDFIVWAEKFKSSC